MQFGAWCTSVWSSQLVVSDFLSSCSWNENIKHPDEPFTQQQAVILESEVSRALLTAAPPDLHDGLSCSGPLLRSAYQSSISAAGIREGELSCHFWIYASLHVPSLRFWARVGKGRSPQVEHCSTREWSEVSICSSAHVINWYSRFMHLPHFESALPWLTSVFIID